MKYFIIFVLTGLLACAPSLYQPSVELAVKTGHFLDELQQGRQLYVDRCGSCHQLHLPKEFSETIWRNNLDSMKIKAKITDREKQLILDYLISGK